MIVGVPKEVKDHETRVGLVPSGVTALCEAGHKVLVQSTAGAGSVLTDEEYIGAGAIVLPTAAEVWRRADLVVKVKEPQPQEYGHLRPGLILFTYLHLAPLPELTNRMLEAKVSGVAYETIHDADGSLPLLTPMSEVAGRMSVQVGAQYLEAFPAAAHAHERGGRTHVRPGGRAVSGGAQRRARVLIGLWVSRTVRNAEARKYTRRGAQNEVSALPDGNPREAHNSWKRKPASTLEKRWDCPSPA
jgi:alanine dehydrogenase